MIQRSTQPLVHVDHDGLQPLVLHEPEHRLWTGNRDDAAALFFPDTLVNAAHILPHRDDVRNMIAVRGAELDWNYIERWCAIDGTITLLGEIRDSIPPAWTAPL